MSWVLVLLSEAVLGGAGGGVGWLIDGSRGLVWGAMVLIAAGLLMAGLSGVLARHIAGARREGGSELNSMVGLLAHKAGVGPLAVYIINDPAPNALAFGWGRKRGIAVTTGLMATMDPEQVAGVLAHEISHVANHDTRVLTLGVGTVGLLGTLADLMLGAGMLGGRGMSEALEDTALVAGAVIGVVAGAETVIQAGMSRRREELADLAGAELAGSTQGLRRALETIQASGAVVRRGRRSLGALYINSPRQRWRILANHPPLAKRIAVLERLEVTN